MLFTLLCLTALTLLGFALMAFIADGPHNKDELWRVNEDWFERLIDDQEYGWCCVCEMGQTRKSWGEQLTGKVTLRSDLAFLRFRIETRWTDLKMSLNLAIRRHMIARWPNRYPGYSLDFVLQEHDDLDPHSVHGAS